MKKLLKPIISVLTALYAVSAFALTAFAEGEQAASNNQSGGSLLMQMIIPLALIFILMYFLMIRPQKKQEKKTKEMQDNIQVGDEIVTIGGIVGLVVRKGDDNVVIETGGERNKMRIKLWAVSENTSALEREKDAKTIEKAKDSKESDNAASGTPKKGTAEMAMSSAKLKDDDDTGGQVEEKKQKKDKKNK